jgi:hypothetical protein
VLHILTELVNVSFLDHRPSGVSSLGHVTENANACFFLDQVQVVPLCFSFFCLVPNEHDPDVYEAGDFSKDFYSCVPSWRELSPKLDFPHLLASWH